MRDPAALLAAIYDDPLDDELRRVYGDLLIELGDPRGELIQLQLSRLERGASTEQREREQALIERYGADWIGPIVVVAETYVIEKGFLWKCYVPWHRSAYNVDRVAGHEAWSTVEDFHGPAAIYLHPVMRALQSLTAWSFEGLDELCTGSTERGLRTLRIATGSVKLPPPHVLSARALPQLQRLAVDGAREPGDLQLLGESLGSHVEQLACENVAVGRRLPEWIDAANRHLRVPELELKGGWGQLGRWMLRRRDGRYDHLVIDVKPGMTIAAALAAARDRIARVDLILDGGSLPPELGELVGTFPESAIVHGRAS